MTKKFIIWDNQLNIEKDLGVEEGFESSEQAKEYFADYWSDVVYDELLDNLGQQYPEKDSSEVSKMATKKLQEMTPDEMLDFWAFEVREM